MALSPKRFWRKLAVLTKIETDYGVSSAPTGAANAMQMTDVQLTPLAGDEVRRDLMLPYFGNQGALLVGDYVELQGSVEIAGSGTRGTAPAMGPLLRACSLSETVLAGTSVTYAPVTDNPESATLFANLDGVNHALLGLRATVTAEWTPKQIPRFRFTCRGLLGPIADTALPVVDLAKFKTPVPVSKVNTTLSLHGVAQIGESLSIDLANTLETRNVIGEDSIEITDRQSTGTAVVEAKTLAIKNWFAAAQARTRGPLALSHGTVAGNIVALSAPAVEIGRPTYGQTQGITNYSLPLLLCPTAGNDEFTLTFA